MTYGEWIGKNCPSKPTGALGHCAEFVDLMAAVFPELRKTRGFYHCHKWGRRTHWWLVAPDGSVVDPTVLQFPSAGLGKYEELADADLPIGRCMECGELVMPRGYGSSQFCNEEHEKRFSANL